MLLDLRLLQTKDHPNDNNIRIVEHDNHIRRINGKNTQNHAKVKFTQRIVWKKPYLHVKTRGFGARFRMPDELPHWLKRRGAPNLSHPTVKQLLGPDKKQAEEYFAKIFVMRDGHWLWKRLLQNPHFVSTWKHPYRQSIYRAFIQRYLAPQQLPGKLPEGIRRLLRATMTEIRNLILSRNEGIYNRTTNFTTTKNNANRARLRQNTQKKTSNSIGIFLQNPNLRIEAIPNRPGVYRPVFQLVLNNNSPGKRRPELTRPKRTIPKQINKAKAEAKRYNRLKQSLLHTAYNINLTAARMPDMNHRLKNTIRAREGWSNFNAQSTNEQSRIRQARRRAQPVILPEAPKQSDHEKRVQFETVQEEVKKDRWRFGGESKLIHPYFAPIQSQSKSRKNQKPLYREQAIERYNQGQELRNLLDDSWKIDWNPRFHANAFKPQRQAISKQLAECTGGDMIQKGRRRAL